MTRVALWVTGLCAAWMMSIPVFAQDIRPNSEAEQRNGASPKDSPAPPWEWHYGGFVDLGYSLNFNFPENHQFRNRSTTPKVNELDSVFLYDIDDLGKVVDQNLKGRIKVAEDAEDIIREEVERMMARLKTREVAPTIVSLQEKLEGFRQGEIERLRGKLGALTPQQEEAIEALTRGLVSKIAHGPISELRKSSEDPRVLDTIRRLFRLGGD